MFGIKYSSECCKPSWQFLNFNMVEIICWSYIHDFSYIYNLLTIMENSISKFLFHYSFVTKFCSYFQWPPTLCFQNGCRWHFWCYVTRRSTGAYKSVSGTLLSICDGKIVNGEKSLAIRSQKLHHRHCVKSVRIRSFLVRIFTYSVQMPENTD